MCGAYLFQIDVLNVDDIKTPEAKEVYGVWLCFKCLI